MAKRQRPKSGFHPRQARIDPRALLADLEAEFRRMKTEERRLVDELRSDGATWREIAALTGCKSPQAARYRFTREHPPQDDPKPQS